MPIADIIGGAQASSGDAVDTTTEVTSSFSAGSAGDAFEEWLNDRTPRGVEWDLNFSFIVAILSGVSSIVSIFSWVS